MSSLTLLPDTFSETRDALQRVAVQIVARARSQATGRFGLRVTNGGFGTPEFGDDLTRLRVSGGLLVRETAGVDGASGAAIAIDGSSLADLAQFAGVDLTVELNVGHDTPDLGDTSELLSLDAAAAEVLAAWNATVVAALDRVLALVPTDAAASSVQLWPEHFDVALALAAAPGQRLNLGGSPGDGFRPDPYVYVGPWTADRPGDELFWNAPFGGVLGYDELSAGGDPVTHVARFFESGIRQFAS
jgi:hypothetical protein